MAAPIVGLAIGIVVQLVQEALAAKARGDTLTDEQRHLLDLAEEESFKRLAEATGHGGEQT